MERVFSASDILRRRKTLDMHIFLRFINHSQALKHDVDFPNYQLVKPLVTIRNVTDCCVWLLYFLNHSLALFNT